MTTWTVYRCYNAGNELVYVGVSANLADRLRQLGYEKTWWKEVARITRQPFSNEGDARREERREALASQPVYNVYKGRKSDSPEYGRAYRLKNRDQIAERRREAQEKANRQLELTLALHQPGETECAPSADTSSPLTPERSSS